MNSNNQVTIQGYIAAELLYSHEVFGEKFFDTCVAVFRESGAVDFVPLMVSERLVDPCKEHRGRFLEVTGQFRSFNQCEEEKKKLVLYVFATDITWLEEENYCNEAVLEGFICKKPVYRKTPLGREIADVLLAVNRPYGKSDYIPCICWGRTAKYASGLDVGTKVKMRGRIQSREYFKKIEDKEIKKEAYELSVFVMERIPDKDPADAGKVLGKAS